MVIFLWLTKLTVSYLKKSIDFHRNNPELYFVDHNIFNLNTVFRSTNVPWTQRKSEFFSIWLHWYMCIDKKMISIKASKNCIYLNSLNLLLLVDIEKVIWFKMNTAVALILQHTRSRYTFSIVYSLYCNIINTWYMYIRLSFLMNNPNYILIVLQEWESKVCWCTSPSWIKSCLSIPGDAFLPHASNAKNHPASTTGWCYIQQIKFHVSRISTMQRGFTNLKQGNNINHLKYIYVLLLNNIHRKMYISI